MRQVGEVITGGCHCTADLILRSSRHGLFWGCTTFPRCDGKVGAHQDSGEPLGTVGDKDTRQARIDLHDLFDQFWSTPAERRYCYSRLALDMGVDEVHIGDLDQEDCERAAAIVGGWD